MMTLSKKKQKNAGTIAVMTEIVQRLTEDLKSQREALDKAILAEANPEGPKPPFGSSELYKRIEATTVALEYRKADLAKQQAFKVVR